MTDDEFNKWWETFQRPEDQTKMQRAEFGKQVVPGVLKMPIEGFWQCEASRFLACHGEEAMLYAV